MLMISAYQCMDHLAIVCSYYDPDRPSEGSYEVIGKAWIPISPDMPTEARDTLAYVAEAILDLVYADEGHLAP